MPARKADGTKIRAAREDANLTVDELVEVLETQEGITRHPDTIRNVELGHAQPGLKLFNAIAKVLHVSRKSLYADIDAAEVSA